jgi:hypothetical protein
MREQQVVVSGRVPVSVRAALTERAEATDAKSVSELVATILISSMKRWQPAHANGRAAAPESLKGADSNGTQSKPGARARQRPG